MGGCSFSMEKFHSNVLMISNTARTVEVEGWASVCKDVNVLSTMFGKSWGVSVLCNAFNWPEHLMLFKEKLSCHLTPRHCREHANDQILGKASKDPTPKHIHALGIIDMAAMLSDTWMIEIAPICLHLHSLLPSTVFSFWKNPTWCWPTKGLLIIHILFVWFITCFLKAEKRLYAFHLDGFKEIFFR